MIGQGQGCCLGDYSLEEKQAFTLLYAYPAGTTIDQFIADENITRTALNPLPHLDGIMRWDATSESWLDAKEDPGAVDSVDFWASPGDYIILKGSRLTLRWLTEGRTSFRAPDYTLPTVHFGDIDFSADLDHQRCPTTPPVTACATGEPSNTRAGSPARFLKVRVPVGASSGWVMVNARNLESNPVWLEIR